MQRKIMDSKAWMLVGDLMATRISVVRGEVAATSPGDLVGHEGVADKSHIFNIFQDSLENFSSLQVRPNVLSTMETSQRPAGDQED